MAPVLYLGPPGTFTHMAAKLAFADAGALAAESTIAGVFERVALGEAGLGVVPIENSSEGSVALTLDCLLTSSLQIQKELVLDVEHCLVASHREPERWVRVASHPQALAQCRRWLAGHLPDRELVPVASTAAAALEAARDPALAAIASRLAAELSGLLVVSSGIQDRSPNVTRFVVVGPGSVAPSGRDRTSVVFSLPHEKGALRAALGVFESAGLNLSRIESRPLPGRLWEYLFFVDVEGHASDPALAGALDTLSRSSGMLRVLGSYPRAF